MSRQKTSRRFAWGVPTLASLLLACSSSGSDRAPLTPEAELPASYALAWRAWYEDVGESELWE